MFKKFVFPAAVLAASLFASSAHAAQTLVISGPSGTFGDDEVTCGGAVGPCAFTRTFQFMTPVGFNIASANISSIATVDALTNIDFSSVTFNGVNFNTLSSGTQEFRNLLNQNLVQGGNNILNVAGTTGGNGSFSGNLSFATTAVPEPATWFMMLFGFGLVGSALRRRKTIASFA